MKALNPYIMSKSISSLPSPSEEFMRWRRSMQPLHQDVLCDVAHQAYLVTRSCHYQLLDGMEYAHFPQRASGSTYIHVEPIQEEMNFKLKKQVALTTTLTKELDSTTEEVEFWQRKYKEAM
jgi:hypothetical protein